MSKRSYSPTRSFVTLCAALPDPIGPKELVAGEVLRWYEERC